MLLIADINEIMQNGCLQKLDKSITTNLQEGKMFSEKIAHGDANTHSG
jgi:hypothetical protein